MKHNWEFTIDWLVAHNLQHQIPKSVVLFMFLTDIFEPKDYKFCPN